VAAIGALAAPLLEATSAPFSRATREIANVERDAQMEPRAAQFRVEMRLAAEAIALWIRAPKRWVLEILNVGVRGAVFAFEMAAISTVVQIGLALPMAEYFHRVSFTGLTANLFVVPLLNIVVPMGFLAIFTGWHWAASIAAALLKWAAAIADWHARLEPSWRVADPPLWIAVGLVVSLVGMAMVVGRTKGTGDASIPDDQPSALRPQKKGTDRSVHGHFRSEDGQRTRGDRVVSPVFLRSVALAAVLGSFAQLLWHPTLADLRAGELELTAMDVGQGDSLLVVFPDSKIMIVDGGGMLVYGRARKPNLDTGEDVVSPYLWSRGITRVDVIAVTHGHEDHSGGIAALIENFHPREVWVGAKPAQKVIDAAARRHVPVIGKRAGEDFSFGGARVDVISPPVDYVPKREAGNNDSLGMRVAFGKRSFLLTGDMERPMEARALGDGLTIVSDVLKVGHHGSKTSTIEPFLDAVRPSIAVISAGFENSFGHPHRDVLARLAEHHTAILRTDLDGLITIRTDGNRISMDTMAWRESSAWWIGERGFNWALASDW
jgi:competence protein ComEC